MDSGARRVETERKLGEWKWTQREVPPPAGQSWKGHHNKPGPGPGHREE